MRQLILLAALAAPPTSFGDEFLGIEQGSEEEIGLDQNVETLSDPDATSRSSEQSRGTWSGSGGIWPAVNQFSAALTISYLFNPYMGIDTHGYYTQFKTPTFQGTIYGPEMNFVVRLPNPTMVTPFSGFGVGYDRWARFYENELFDDAGSVTAAAFVGIQIYFTKHFGLQGMRKQKVYLADAPVSFDDRKTEEPQSRLSNSVGFFFAF